MELLRRTKNRVKQAPFCGPTYGLTSLNLLPVLYFHYMRYRTDPMARNRER